MTKRVLMFSMSLAMIGMLFLSKDPSVASGSDSFVIIANQSVPVSSMSRNKLKDYFLGVEVVWEDSTGIIITTLKPCDTHTAFTKTITGKTAAQFKATWRKLLFLGQASVPKSFSTEKELVEFIANTEGAIGYVSILPQDGRIKKIEITD